jgi:hypothetical protein
MPVLFHRSRARGVSAIEPIRFTSTIRYWDPARNGGLAVADVPADLVPVIGGLRQQHVRGSIAGQPFASSVMPAGKGRLALSVSRQMMKAAGIEVGDHAEVEISAVGRD